MNNRSKSSRKRRLQLNAEEFAPPSDMYEASEEPRLDETWMQFYGGERQGIKRLSTLDDEAPADTNVAAHVKPFPPTDISTPSPPEPGGVTRPSPVDSSQDEGQPPERRPRPVPSPVRHLKNTREVDTVEVHSRTVSQAQLPQATAQLLESKEAKPLEPGPEYAPSPGKSDTTTPSFEDWSRRWSPWLKRGGSIKVCEAFFRLTHARGSAECFTSNSEIMKLAELSRAQCIRNIHYLIEIGFLDELNEVNNRVAKGTYYRFNLVPTSLVPSQS